MRSSVKIGRVFKTPMRIHYTWILVIVLISWAVSTQYSNETAIFTRFALGAAASVVFLIFVFMREIALLLLAISKGVMVNSIIIFAFGGLVEVDPETSTPSHEMLLAIAGMISNLVITGIFYLAYVLLAQRVPEVYALPLKWLAFLYITLSAFHVIPAFPLEGGRILHVILWKASDDFPWAMRIAGWISRVLGFIIMVGGILILIFTIERVTGVFLVGIGLILQNAATHSIRQTKRIMTMAPSGTGEAL